MADNAKRKKRKSTFPSAMAVGLLFGIFLVILQEFVGQQRLLKAYEQASVQQGQQYMVQVQPTASAAALEDLSAELQPELGAATADTPAAPDANTPEEGLAASAAASTMEPPAEPAASEAEQTVTEPAVSEDAQAQQAAALAFAAEQSPKDVIDMAAAAAAQNASGIRTQAADGSVAYLCGTQTMQIDFASIAAATPDFVGWLYIPGTDISYPVVQGTDNEYYLHHLMDGSYSNVGTLFVDSRNNMEADESLIIYGHNMRGGAMFGTLPYFGSQSFFDLHPTAYFLTQECGFQINFFSAYTTTVADEAYTLTHPTDEDYSAWLADRAARSAIASSYSPVTTRQTVMLSTCTVVQHDGRFIMLGQVSFISNT